MYWESTPREIDACVRKFLEWQDVESYRFGTIAAASWNAARATKKHFTKWQDWIPPFIARKRVGDDLKTLVAKAKKNFLDMHPNG